VVEVEFLDIGLKASVDFLDDELGGIGRDMQCNSWVDGDNEQYVCELQVIGHRHHEYQVAMGSTASCCVDGLEVLAHFFCQFLDIFGSGFKAIR